MPAAPSWIVDRLEANGATFAGLVKGVDDAQAVWRPSPEKWSLIEVINHVADEETEDFGARLRLVLEDPRKAWPPIDPARAVVDRSYNARKLDESLARFLRSRVESIAWLRGLGDVDWNVASVRLDGAQLRAGDLLQSWVVHDLIHIRQINRLHYEYLSATQPQFSSAYAGDW